MRDDDEHYMDSIARLEELFNRGIVATNFLEGLDPQIDSLRERYERGEEPDSEQIIGLLKKMQFGTSMMFSNIEEFLASDLIEEEEKEEIRELLEGLRLILEREMEEGEEEK